MAKKKKAAAKAKPKKAAKVVKMSKAKAAKPSRDRIRSERDQVLPGMEQVRNVRLDRICAGISDLRAEKNRAISEEADLQDQAADEMSEKGIPRYRHRDVELELKKGRVTLAVHIIKKKAEKGAEPKKQDAAPAEEQQPDELAADADAMQDDAPEDEAAQA